MEWASVGGIVGLSVGALIALYLLVACGAAPLFSKKPKTEHTDNSGVLVGDSQVRFAECCKET